MSDKSSKKWIKVQVSESLHREVKSEAAASGLKLEGYVRQIIERRKVPK
jgi:predicted DNA binding CopG/RHH family protein